MMQTQSFSKEEKEVAVAQVAGIVLSTLYCFVAVGVGESCLGRSGFLQR